MAVTWEGPGEADTWGFRDGGTPPALGASKPTLGHGALSAGKRHIVGGGDTRQGDVQRVESAGSRTCCRDERIFFAN